MIQKKLLKISVLVSEDIAIIIDTKGPEIRISKGELDFEVSEGDVLKIKGSASDCSTKEMLVVNHPDFIKEIKLRDIILIDDGSIELEVIEKTDFYVACLVKNKGTIKARKSINVPNASFSLPSYTQKDKDYIQFAIENNIDFIAHSFVRSKKDIKDIQRIIDEKNSQLKIIAKIENQEGVDNIDEIIESSYGIMVARGDLAIEIPYERIPNIQKMIIDKCIEARKPVIIATQMLHSMIENPRPTRAEVTDVANAIYTNADAIMLSGETAFGNYPIEAVATMSRIAIEVEKTNKDFLNIPVKILSTKTSAYLSKSAVEASNLLEVKAIVADTTTGRTIRNAAGYRGKKIIYAQCYDKRTVRELALSFGVYPSHLTVNKAHGFIHASLEKLVVNGTLSDNDLIIFLGGNFGKRHGASFINISIVENLRKLD
jgi:pyruvate kinase